MAVTPPHVTRARVARACLPIKLSNTLINVQEPKLRLSIHNMESENTAPQDQVNSSPDEHDHDEEDVVEPQEEMDLFDWDALETEYINKMAECKAEEDAHLQEFASLSRFFGVWAETISGHEQKRSHQRYAHLQSGSETCLILRFLA